MFSIVEFPATVVMNSISKIPDLIAKRIAIASSFPGSVSIIHLILELKFKLEISFLIMGIITSFN